MQPTLQNLDLTEISEGKMKKFHHCLHTGWAHYICSVIIFVCNVSPFSIKGNKNSNVFGIIQKEM